MAITAKMAIEAIRGSRGFVTTVAKNLDCSRQHVYNLIDRYPTVKQALEDERETLKDFAESKLFKQIDAENMTAIIFYLKTQAKDRGYIERQHYEHSGEMAIAEMSLEEWKKRQQTQRQQAKDALEDFTDESINPRSVFNRQFGFNRGVPGR